MFRVLRKIFGSFWMLMLFITAVISALLFYFGPVIPLGESYPLETMSARIWTIGILFALTFLIIFMRWWLRRRREKRMAREMSAEDEADTGDAALGEEMAEVRKRMREALAILKKSKLGGKGKSVYQLPWYIIIGPPGAGKTTAIVNSGLNFPLAERMGLNALGGIGGTRNCDWWFTDEAVLIDTAGRYTTQDSDAESDAKGWLGFLDMLKRNRKRQPINGAVVAISLSDLSIQDERQCKEHAAAIRLRLSELRQRLGVRFPVYILFTKADLIAGFQEFFENLGREEREQVWGFTFQIKGPKARVDGLKLFDEQYAILLDQLNNLTLERLQQETDSQRRGLINGFAHQVASLQPVARQFLTDVFQQNKFEDQQFLRGVYFTSGTQEGTPIDRLMMGMARTFGIGRQAIGSGTGQGRSYFLKTLLDKVIFGESGLVSADDRVERRYRWTIRLASAAALALAAGLGTVWTLSFMGNQQLVAEARDNISIYAELEALVPGSPIDDIDLTIVAGPLNILRDLPGNPAQDDPAPPRELTWGLYQGEYIGTEAAQTYRRALNRMLLPRLLLKLERQMQANLNNPELLYEALKVYMMLGLQGPIDRDLVIEWMTIDWQLDYGGDANAQLRADLESHLSNMLAQPMQTIDLHGPLVAQVQGLLSETPVAQRVYNSIVASPMARALPEWRVLEQGGPLASRVLIRPSGTPLSEGVPGIFTRRGFYDVFLPAALDVAEQLRKENWVLGERGEDLSDPNALSRIARDVLDLYYTDYIGAYERILGDIDIAPMGAMSDVVAALDILSGPNSPITKLLTAVEEQTRLTQREDFDVGAVTDQVGALVTRDAIGAMSIRTQALVEALQSSSVAAGQPPPPPPGQPVETRFAWLKDFAVGEEGAPSELEQAMQRMTELYQELNRLSTLGAGAGATAGSPAAQNFQLVLNRVPDPMRRWAAQVIEASAGVQAGGVRASINAQWQSQVLPTCTRAIDERYPFFRNQQADVAIQEFARLFAPQGLIDGFFQQHLASHVDTASNPWTWRRIQGQELGISDAVLTQFQRAAEIRDAFFLAPGLPTVTFDLRPVALAEGVQRVQLVIDGQVLDYRVGQPQQVTPMQWPGPGGPTQVAMQPEQRNAENGRAFDGPWAFFRMLDAVEIRSTGVADRSRVVFNIGGRVAMFELRAGASVNPFDLTLLRGFRCPSSL